MQPRVRRVRRVVEVFEARLNCAFRAAVVPGELTDDVGHASGRGQIAIRRARQVSELRPKLAVVLGRPRHGRCVVGRSQEWVGGKFALCHSCEESSAQL